MLVIPLNSICDLLFLLPLLEFFGYQFILIYNSKIYFVRILFIFFSLILPQEAESDKLKYEQS